MQAQLTVVMVTRLHQMPSSTPSKYAGGNMCGFSCRSISQMRWPEMMREIARIETMLKFSGVIMLRRAISQPVSRVCCVRKEIPVLQANHSQVEQDAQLVLTVPAGDQNGMSDLESIL